MYWTRRLRLVLKFILYMMAMCYSMPFLYKVSVGLLVNFFSFSVSFNLDTLFLNWNTTFPAITVCEIYNSEKIWELSDVEFGPEHDMQIDDFISEIVFFRGLCTSCKQCEHLQCPRNFTRLLELFRTKCNELIQNCSYFNKFFDCCEEFLPVRTEYGICYSFNSYQTQRTSQLQFTNNRITGAGHLRFDTLADIQLFVHGPVDIPFFYSEGMIRETILLGSYKELVLNVIEVFNHESILDLPIDQRRCRFAHERTQWSRRLDIYDIYSYSICEVECTVALQLTYCNCSSHYLTTEGKHNVPMCDYNGLICLTRIYDILHQERKSCECMSSCEEPEYNIIYNSADDDQDVEEETSHVRVNLVELPTQRYVRRVAKTNLDLLISVGGIVGLFFNTSALRIVEMLFLLIKYRNQWLRFRFNC